MRPEIWDNKGALIGVSDQGERPAILLENVTNVVRFVILWSYV